MRFLLTNLYFCLFCISSLLATNASGQQAEYDFVGRHFFAQYYDCSPKALNDSKKLVKVMKQAALASGAHILGNTKYLFKPQGFSMILLLSESHASIHTYPEHHACFVDFFTCGNRCVAENFDKILREYLQPKRVTSKVQERK